MAGTSGSDSLSKTQRTNLVEKAVERHSQNRDHSEDEKGGEAKGQFPSGTGTRPSEWKRENGNEDEADRSPEQ